MSIDKEWKDAGVNLWLGYKLEGEVCACEGHGGRRIEI